MKLLLKIAKLSRCAFAVYMGVGTGRDLRSRVCVVLSIEPGTWKDWGRSLSL